MPSDIVGKVLSAVYGFMLLMSIILISQSVIVQGIREARLYNEMQGFVDKVIDTGEIPESLMADMNMAVASSGMDCTVEITRYCRVVSMKADGSGTYDTYIPVNDKYHYNSGDYISIRVQATSYSGSYRVLHSLLGMVSKLFDQTIARRVR